MWLLFATIDIVKQHMLTRIRRRQGGPPPPSHSNALVNEFKKKLRGIGGSQKPSEYENCDDEENLSWEPATTPSEQSNVDEENHEEEDNLEEEEDEIGHDEDCEDKDIQDECHDHKEEDRALDFPATSSEQNDEENEQEDLGNDPMFADFLAPSSPIQTSKTLKDRPMNVEFSKVHHGREDYVSAPRPTKRSFSRTLELLTPRPSTHQFQEDDFDEFAIWDLESLGTTKRIKTTMQLSNEKECLDI